MTKYTFQVEINIKICLLISSPIANEHKSAVPGTIDCVTAKNYPHIQTVLPRCKQAQICPNRQHAALRVIYDLTFPYI